MLVVLQITKNYSKLSHNKLVTNATSCGVFRNSHCMLISLKKNFFFNFFNIISDRNFYKRTLL